MAISFKNKPGIICPGQNLILEAQIFPFDGKHNMMVPPTFSSAGFGDTLAPRPIWTTVSWNNNGDLAGFHWALAVTTRGYNGILILSNPLHTHIHIYINYIYIYTINQYIYINNSFWNFFQPCGRNARNSQMGFRGQQLAYSHQNRGLYNKLYIPSRV